MSIPLSFHRYRLSFAAFVGSVSFLALGLLSGCGVAPESAAPTPLSLVSGIIHGGQSPIQGATVNLYVTNVAATGYGQAGTLIGTATTDVHGAFTIGNPATPANCPAGQQAYITSAGGYPSGASTLVNNSTLLMAALGSCANVSASTSVVINEVTTVAAAYALSGFMTTSASGSLYVANVSAPAANNAATGTSTAAAGLAHAFLNASNIANYASGTARTQTPNISVAGATVNGTVPAVELNTLGDIMQSCVNGVTGNASCTSLYGFTPSISGVAPTNTLQAFINLARNPYPSAAAMSSTTGLLSLVPATAAFLPDLTAVPSDWSLAVSYASTTGPLSNAPYYLALDANDTAYYSTSTGTNIVGLSAYGITTPSYTAGTTSTAGRAIAADALGNIWVANSGTAVYQYSASAGGAPTSYTVTGPSYGIAIDKANNVWVSSAVVSTTNVQELAQSSSYAVNYNAVTPGGFQPYGLTIDANQNVWIAPYFNGGTLAVVLPNLSVGTVSAPSYASSGTVGTPISATLNGSFPKPYGMVTDASGNAWYGISGFTSVTTAGLEEVVPNSFTAPITSLTPGSLIANATLGAKTTNMPAIDGAGSVYLSDTSGGGALGLHVYSTTTASTATSSNVLSPPSGYLGCYPTSTTATTCPNGSVYSPHQAAIDSTGSVWTAMTSGGFSQLIGLAAPTWPLLSIGKPGLSPGSTVVAPLP